MPEKHEYELEWKDEYSVGSVYIDNQHKGLIEMTNELFRGCACEEHEEMLAFMRTIQEAVNYAKVHFDTEERFMKKINYPEFDIHKSEHDTFVAEVLKQVRKFEEGNCTPLEFALFLKNWLFNHIAISDKKFAPFLKDFKEEDLIPHY